MGKISTIIIKATQGGGLSAKGISDALGRKEICGKYSDASENRTMFVGRGGRGALAWRHLPFFEVVAVFGLF